MATTTVEWGGTTEVKAALTTLATQFRDAAAQALREEAEVEMTAAKERTPVLTGALRASGHVDAPEVTETGDVNVTMAFGGPSAPYAVYVHENMEAHHPVGQAKFLESVVNEAAPGMAERLAARIRQITGA